MDEFLQGGRVGVELGALGVGWHALHASDAVGHLPQGGEPFSGPWPRLRQTMAAVGHHYRPGDERGRLVGEKEHARGDLLRRATAPDRSRRCGGGFER